MNVVVVVTHQVLMITSLSPPPPTVGQYMGSGPKLRSLKTLHCLNSLQKASYTLQFILTVILKYFYSNNEKKWAFGTLGAILVILIQKRHTQYF